MALITEYDLALAREQIATTIEGHPEQFGDVNLNALPALIVGVGCVIMVERRRVLQFIEHAVKGGGDLQSAIELLRSAEPK